MGSQMARRSGKTLAGCYSSRIALSMLRPSNQRFNNSDARHADLSKCFSVLSDCHRESGCWFVLSRMSTSPATQPSIAMELCRQSDSRLPIPSGCLTPCQKTLFVSHNSSRFEYGTSFLQSAGLVLCIGIGDIGALFVWGLTTTTS
jgi:hypothetical protein